MKENPKMHEASADVLKWKKIFSAVFIHTVLTVVKMDNALILTQ